MRHALSEAAKGFLGTGVVMLCILMETLSRDVALLPTFAKIAPIIVVAGGVAGFISGYSSLRRGSS